MKKKHQVKKRLAAGALIAGLVAVGSLRAGATPITVQNSDFSNYAHTYTAGPGYAGVPDDWTISSGGDAFVQPTSFNYGVIHNGAKPFTYYGLILFGQYAPSTVVSQTTAYNAKLGDTLTLSVQTFIPWADVSNNDTGTSDNLALTIGGNVVAANTSIGALTSLGNGEGEVATITVSYDVTNPLLANEAVGIELLAPATSQQHSPNGYYDSQYFYDNVSLNVTSAAVPEPSTWALMFAGLLSLVGLSRIKRKA